MKGPVKPANVPDLSPYTGSPAALRPVCPRTRDDPGARRHRAGTHPRSDTSIRARRLFTSWKGRWSTRSTASRRRCAEKDARVRRTAARDGRTLRHPQPTFRHVQPFEGAAEMKLGGHRYERFELAQFHSLAVPRAAWRSQERDRHRGERPGRLTLSPVVLPAAGMRESDSRVTASTKNSSSSWGIRWHVAGFPVLSWQVTLRSRRWRRPGLRRLVAITPNRVRGAVVSLQPPRVDPRCLPRPALGLIGPVSWSTREDRVSAHVQQAPGRSQRRTDDRKSSAAEPATGLTDRASADPHLGTTDLTAAISELTRPGSQRGANGGRRRAT